jgi:hypothetical protein
LTPSGLARIAGTMVGASNFPAASASQAARLRFPLTFAVVPYTGRVPSEIFP